MITPTQRVKQLEARVKLLERALRKAEQDRLTADEIRQKIFGLSAVAPQEFPKTRLKIAFTGRGPGAPVLMLSDWHAGETVRSQETGGLNYYNTTVLTRRVEAIIHNAKHVIDLQWQPFGAGAKPKTIVMPLLGDFVSGEIHDELTRTNDLDPLPSVLLVRDYLRHVILTMANEYGQVLCPCASGNHGRTDRKPTAKRALIRNLDWLIYTMLQRDFSNDRRVSFIIPETNMSFFEIHNVRFLAMHGHDMGVKGGDGIIGSLGPIMRGRAKLAALCEARRTPFDTLLIGHYHQHIIAPGVVVNGTLKGPDEYTLGVLKARPEAPGQALFFVHPEHGITSHWLVRTETETREKKKRDK